jgi:hypothetical protein
MPPTRSVPLVVLNMFNLATTTRVAITSGKRGEGRTFGPDVLWVVRPLCPVTVPHLGATLRLGQS